MKGLVTLLDKLASTADTKDALLDFAKAQLIHHPPVRKQFKVAIGGIAEVLSYSGDHDRKSCLKRALTMKQKMSSVYDALDNLNRTEMIHFGKNILKLTGLGGDKVSRLQKCGRQHGLFSTTVLAQQALRLLLQAVRGQPVSKAASLPVRQIIARHRGQTFCLLPRRYLSR